MQELKDMTNVIRNLHNSRLFTLQSDQESKQSTADALEGSIRKAVETGDGLQYSLIHSNAYANTLMTAAESQELVEYLAVRRDVLALLNVLTDPETPEAQPSAGGNVNGAHEELRQAVDEA